MKVLDPSLSKIICSRLKNISHPQTSDVTFFFPVHARVIVLDSYRRPWQPGSLDVFLYSPMGDEMQRWIARHAKMGVVEIEYELAKQETIPGEWTIRAATR
jgi:hypothetical protein